MPTSSHPNLPLELIEILNEISRNVADVRDRITRIEAQEHSDSIKSIKADLERERNHRIQLQIEVANIKTKIAPFIVGVSLIGAALVDIAGRILVN